MSASLIRVANALLGGGRANNTFVSTRLNPSSWWWSTLSVTTASTNVQNETLQHRCYVSRAHGRTIPEYPLTIALKSVLQEIEDRKVKRLAKWERNAPIREKKGVKDDGPYRGPDEMLELAINLNLDPRRPGQAIRGTVPLPHGTGKTIRCVVFTKDQDLAAKCIQDGLAIHAGGEELISKIADGSVSVDSFQRSLATQDMVGPVQKQLARILGPRGLMPNVKTGTVFTESNDLLDNIQTQSSSVTFRAESAGIVHVPIGKGSFTETQLLENIQAVCHNLQAVRPEFYGKGRKGGGGKGSKKMGKNVRYFLRAHISSTQGKGIRIDIRTVDPSSPFFLLDPNQY